jgi:hypothetical protein
VVFPIALSVTFGVAELLAAMADHTWAQVLHRTCLLGAVVWVVNLICLLVALAVHAVVEDHSTGD